MDERDREQEHRVGQGLAAALRPLLSQLFAKRGGPEPEGGDYAELRRMARLGEWDAMADYAQRRRSAEALRSGLCLLVEEAERRRDEDWLRERLGDFEAAGWAMDVDPGAIFESAARCGRRVGRILVEFACRPPERERVQAAIAQLARGDEARLRVFEEEMERSFNPPPERERAPGGERVLDEPTRALHARSPDILLGAIVVDLVRGEAFYWEDYRDLFHMLAPFHHCAAQLGVQPQTLFEEAAAAGPALVADLVRGFGRRSTREVTGPSWGFDVIPGPDGPRYIETR